MNKLYSRIVIVIALIALLAGAFAFAVPQAKAADGTFNISVYHGINGRSLGLDKELPVVATVYKDGAWLAEIPLEFKDRFTADLPAGTYLIKVEAVGVGPIPSMTVGPVSIPADVDVRIQAQLSGGKTPILNARVK
jgi:hypothetical protein